MPEIDPLDNINEPEMVTATIPKKSLLEMLSMMYSTGHNLNVFYNTPAYEVDKQSLEYMMKGNAMLMDYLCIKFEVPAEDVVTYFKAEMENGNLKMVETAPVDPRSVTGVEFQ
jgi:hypothetical protein